MEIDITGTNAITYPYLHIWDWRIATYLFLGGITAGILALSAVINFRRSKFRSGQAACCYLGPLMAPFILAIGMFFILLDLGRPFNSYWFYLSFQPSSPMSWGAWGVGLIIPVSFLYGLAAVPEEKRGILRFCRLSALSARLRPHLRKLAGVNFGLGIFLGIYTGVLLSSFIARPLWNSPVLPVLFMASSLSTGAAVIIIVSRDRAIKLFFTKVDIWLIFAEIVILALFFYGHYVSNLASRESIMPFFDYRSEFFPYWLAIFLLAILLPVALVLELADIREDAHKDMSFLTVLRMDLSASMVLLGGFIIRLAIIYAGQLSRLA